MKRFLAIALSFTLCVGLTPAGAPATAEIRAKSQITDRLETTGLSDDYINGQALITLALPDGATSDLLNEGAMPGDPTIRVRDVMEFGSADVLGSTRKSRKSLRGDNLYVVRVSSASRTTEELMSYLSGYSYVHQTMPNYKLHKTELTKMTWGSDSTSVPQDSNDGVSASMVGEGEGTDPLSTGQWSLGGSSFHTSDGATIGYETETVSTDADAPIVAVIDDGVDYTHEDLVGRIWENPYPDMAGKYGFDFVGGDEDPMPAEYDSHGTKIAGIIAADTNNGVGIAGISGSAKIMPLRIFDGDESDLGDELAAFEYVYQAEQHGANIVAVNCSYGTGPIEYRDDDLDAEVSVIDSITKKIGAQGALVVYSAGNESSDLDVYKYGTPQQYDNTYLLRVGSSTYTGEMSYFSNYGARNVELMAPGSMILTTARDYNYLPEAYDSAKRESLSLFFQEFSADVGSAKTIEDLMPSRSSSLEISHAAIDFYGVGQGGACGAYIKRVRIASNYAYCIFYDVTDYNINPNLEYYLSFDIAFEEDGEGNWQHLSGPISAAEFVDVYSFDGRIYLSLDLKRLISEISNYIGQSFYIDNLSLSKPDLDITQFGKYDFVDGTSFSAPHVAAAVARLASMYPGDNARTRREKLLSSVRVLPSLEGLCSTGGTLDMSAFASKSDISVGDTRYKVKKITLNKKSVRVKAGKKVKLKAKVKPDYATNPALSWKVDKSKYATISSRGVLTTKKSAKGHTVKVTAKAKDGSGKKAVCTVKIV